MCWMRRRMLPLCATVREILPGLPLASFGTSLRSKCWVTPKYCTRTDCPTEGPTERTNHSWIGVWRVGFLWMDTSGPRDHSPHIHQWRNICVPYCTVSQVIGAVHACAHPAETPELFLRRFHANMPYARLRETVNKALSDCVVCTQANARRGPHPDSCQLFPVPSLPFSSVAIDFVDLPEVRTQ